MVKQRIQVYASEETKRRIELAAAKHDVPVTEYCLAAIVQRLADEDMLEREQIEIPVTPGRQDDTLITDLRALREAIRTDRGGRLIDVDTILEQVREERDEELLGLCWCQSDRAYAGAGCLQSGNGSFTFNVAADNRYHSGCSSPTGL